MSTPSHLNVVPGILFPELAAQFIRLMAGKSSEARGNDLAVLAHAPNPEGWDLLTDICIQSAQEDNIALCDLVVTALALAKRQDNEYVRACLRLIVNRQFAPAVRLMRLRMSTDDSATGLNEWYLAALRYYYRHALEGDDQAGKEAMPDLVMRIRDAAQRIDDDHQRINLFTLIEPRQDPTFSIPGTTPAGAPIMATPPLLLNTESRLQATACPPLAEPPQGFAHLRMAVIVGGRSTIFIDGDKLADDPLSDMNADDFSPFTMESAYIGTIYGMQDTASGQRQVAAKSPEPRGIISRGIFLNGHYQFNYFHWICEYLILLSYLDEQAAYTDWPLLISDEALAHPNHLEALKHAAGAHTRSVVTLAKDIAYKVDELLLLPKVTRVTLCHRRIESHPDDYGFAPDAVRRLHVALSYPGGPRRKRIFLGRKKNDRLLNQAEIQAEFEKAGFEIVYPETLSFQEARQLFSTVDVLAGPTGAAFTNLILCPPGATAIIMTTTHGSHAGFFSGLAAPLEQRVIYLHGPGTDPNQTISPFSVDIADVQRVLSLLAADA